MNHHLSNRQFQKSFLILIILSMFCLYGCNLPNKEKVTENRPDKSSINEISEGAETDTNETVNAHLFDSFIGKDKEYVEKNANQFIEKDGHYIIYVSDTEESNDCVEVIFNAKNEVEYLVWNSGKSLDPSKLSDYLEATLMAPKKLGLLDGHETKKTGSLIGNYVVTIYKDNIMCLYDFNNDFYFKETLINSE